MKSTFVRIADAASKEYGSVALARRCGRSVVEDEDSREPEPAKGSTGRPQRDETPAYKK